jgi:hypothetical protein
MTDADYEVFEARRDEEAHQMRAEDFSGGLGARRTS